MSYRFLVVDDEKMSRDYIRNLINEFMPGSTISEASSAKTALSLIQTEQPEILFLDIKMPGTDGFELLDMIPKRECELVFITAYSHYAIKAIKEGACDYLLKPIKKSDFKITLQRAVEKYEERNSSKTKTPKDDHYLDQKFVVNHHQGMKMILLRDVVYLKADNTYTTIFLINKEKIITSKPIHRFEELLDNNWFFRIHKSYIINMHYFREYSSKEGNVAIMDTGEQLTISRYRYNDFMEKIKNFTGKLKL